MASGPKIDNRLPPFIMFSWMNSVLTGPGHKDTIVILLSLNSIAQSNVLTSFFTLLASKKVVRNKKKERTRASRIVILLFSH